MNEQLSRELLRKVCIFRVGRSLFAVDGKFCQEIATIEDRTVVPRSPSYLSGVANLRGTALPLVRLESLLQMPSHEVDTEIALVTRADDLLVGLLVEEIRGFNPYQPSDIMPLGPSSPVAIREFAIGLMRLQTELVTFLDVGKVLNALRILGTSSTSDRQLLPEVGFH